MCRQHPAHSMAQRFSPKTGPLSSNNKFAYNLTSKFLYINTQYLGLIGILGMTLMQPWWKRGTWSTGGDEGRRVSHCSLWEWISGMIACETCLPSISLVLHVPLSIVVASESSREYQLDLDIVYLCIRILMLDYTQTYCSLTNPVFGPKRCNVESAGCYLYLVWLEKI